MKYQVQLKCGAKIDRETGLTCIPIAAEEVIANVISLAKHNEVEIHDNDVEHPSFKIIPLEYRLTTFING
tara:strand:- start:1188 stop:1397 length:210 start_codon:yes stop_codon:yes gene_type:complete